jgi:hypothetical protein
MPAKPSTLVTITVIVVTVLIAGGIFFSSILTTAAYGAASSSSHRNENNFCFTTSEGTGSLAAASSTIGADTLTTITTLNCYDNMGACKKAENQFVNDGTTVIGINCEKNPNIATG